MVDDKMKKTKCIDEMNLEHWPKEQQRAVIRVKAGEQ